ncbi:chaperone protein dnaJ GFA2, mitochondrial-like [Amborella trichopoda]|uniref:chaperone protein dnaJ GFA2, mitochondrial-like n=1 Tax=Amborella trichopoda TaxID=13333 RepID=UPI0009BD98AF|nr:chaperone protein dnaJ GFA2, mitochondrial-like [Amborella trichopoda]XP_020524428.1 chaperone protein dnaJ GFA2, mitochondrial-like [Amborella trichopoda]|eukprot:XP_020524427.1 chaperone protein dnaJ GFA2, mitochondrial-like [Amborella trichopoda]
MFMRRCLDAILGGAVPVPTLMGDVILKVPQGTQPGQKVICKGKGIRNGRPYQRGKQYIHFNNKVSTNLSDRQCCLIEDFVKEKGE